MTCRNSQDDVETGGKVVAPGTSLGGALKPGPSGIRLGGCEFEQRLEKCGTEGKGRTPYWRTPCAESLLNSFAHSN
jgi:hypothetical protein